MWVILGRLFLGPLAPVWGSGTFPLSFFHPVEWEMLVRMRTRSSSLDNTEDNVFFPKNVLVRVCLRLLLNKFCNCCIFAAAGNSFDVKYLQACISHFHVFICHKPWWVNTDTCFVFANTDKGMQIKCFHLHELSRTDKYFVCEEGANTIEYHPGNFRQLMLKSVFLNREAVFILV